MVQRQTYLWAGAKDDDEGKIGNGECSIDQGVWKLYQMSGFENDMSWYPGAGAERFMHFRIGCPRRGAFLWALY